MSGMGDHFCCIAYLTIFLNLKNGNIKVAIRICEHISMIFFLNRSFPIVFRNNASLYFNKYRVTTHTTCKN